jgi:hypothetical protein
MLGHDDPHDLGPTARKASDSVRRMAIYIIVIYAALMLLSLGLLYLVGALP